MLMYSFVQIKKRINSSCIRFVNAHQLTCLLPVIFIFMALSGCGIKNGDSSPSLQGARPAIQAGEYSSIQAALEEVPAEGGIVHLPPGEFEENNDALHCFDGFNLCMSGNNLDDHLGNGVVIENTYGSVISGNMIEECQGTAIVLDRDCYGINLASNVIAHNGGGVELQDAHGISVSANTFTINKAHAILFGSQCGRITVSGNNFSNSYIGEGKVKRDTGDLAAAGVTLDGGRNIAFSGNVFAGIQPDKAFKIRKQTNNIIFGNNLLIDSESEHRQLDNSLVNDNLVRHGNSD